MEGDRLSEAGVITTEGFQSTPSVRRATLSVSAQWLVDIISIHALRAEGDQQQMELDKQLKISIHALRAEGDRYRLSDCVAHSLFQSTPSVRRATAMERVAVSTSGLFQSTPSVRRATPSIERSASSL